MNSNSKRVQFPTSEELVMLGRESNERKYCCIMMMALTAKNKASLDKNGFIVNPLNNEIIPQDNIILYGDVDFKTEKDVDDWNSCGFNWCDDIHGSFVPLDFDYETNTGLGIEVNYFTVRPALRETYDTKLMYLYGHARLGKPKEVVIFKKMINKRKEPA